MGGRGTIIVLTVYKVGRNDGATGPFEHRPAIKRAPRGVAPSMVVAKNTNVGIEHDD